MNVTISGYTKVFAVLGHPIGHTLSPIMHNAAITTLGMDAIYLAFNVAPEKLPVALEAMRDMGLGGVNLTIPLKEVAFRHLRELDDSARSLGAVNTVEFGEHGLVGHNTDGYGFLKAMDEAFDHRLIADASVFVLGVGGAGRAVAITAACAGAARIILSDLNEALPPKVAAEISEQVGATQVDVAQGIDEQLRIAPEADIIVHATPVGMKPDDVALWPASAFRPGQCVFDLIYMVPETVFMQSALEAGADAANGLGMLLHQGARAFEIWTDAQPPVEVMRTALQKAVYT